MKSRRKSVHTESSENKTFTEVSSEPWPAEASEPYIRHYPDPENSDIGKAFTYSELLLAIAPTSSILQTVYRGQPDSVFLSMVAMPVYIPAEWEDVPALPGIYLANMGERRINIRMLIFGTAMDVCKTEGGVKALRGWNTDPSEIALYESECHLCKKSLL